MNALSIIPQDAIVFHHNQIRTNSLKVAEAFGKRHDNVLRKLQSIDCSENFTALNFEVSEFADSTGRKLPMWEMTKDGFIFLVMGFTGAKAAQVKEAYITAFNKMAADLEKNKAPQKDPRELALQQQKKLMRSMTELKKSLDKAALEGEYIAASSSKLVSPELALNYTDRFQGKDYLSHGELYPGTWDVSLLGLICNLEQYEGRAVPLQVSGTKVLKRELMSLLLLVDMQSRKLDEIKRLTTH